MARMNSETRKSVIEICKRQGFSVQLKSDGNDLYQKNLVFNSKQYASTVVIRKDTGINTAGNLGYLKFAVHPDYFRENLINPTNGIEEFLNNKTKINRHSSSNYTKFPTYEGNSEPCGKCYKVKSLIALESLLIDLKDSWFYK